MSQKLKKITVGLDIWQLARKTGTQLRKVWLSEDKRIYCWLDGNVMLAVEARNRLENVLGSLTASMDKAFQKAGV